MCINFAVAIAAPPQKPDTTFHIAKLGRKEKSYLKPNIHIGTPVVKSYIVTPSKTAMVIPDDKLLSNVQVYPNPVTDQINIKYVLSRNSNVNIKIMDVLGNEVATLFSQRVDYGEKKFAATISNKLHSGFYFIRIVVGTESINKRISVL
jgi:hypothetical protein